MKNFRLYVVILLSIAFQNTFAQNNQVRIGFMGNSITIGSGLSSPETNCYPSQLQVMLNEVYGDTCLVGNFAVSGRTMLKHGDYPLWNEPEMNEAIRFAPNICVILLGTNDSKPQNWDVYGDEFIDDYLSMVDTFLQRNPKTKFIVCYPPPAYDVVWGIRNSVIVDGVIPAVDSVMKVRESVLVDYYTPLLDSVYLFPDKIHPNVKGAKVMAEILFDKIQETDIIHTVDASSTFVTDYVSDKYSVLENDSVTFSWSTVNADSVYLGGQKVDLVGSMKMKIPVSADYEIVAYGEASTDTQRIFIETQKVQISKLEIESTGNSDAVGETVFLEVIYFDQYDNPIDTITNVNWSIISGLGTFSDQDTNTVFFTIGNASKTIVEAAVGEVSSAIIFRVDINDLTNTDGQTPIEIYPNPVTDQLNIILPDNSSAAKKISIYSIGGKKLYESNLLDNQQILSIDTREMSFLPGTYIFLLEEGSNRYSGRFVKQ